MENVENWVSLREFARIRGVRLGAVQKAIESGRVTAFKRSVEGRLKAIEVNRATAQWNGNTDPDQAARAGAPIFAEPNTPQGAARSCESINGTASPAAASLAPDLLTPAPAADPVAPTEDSERYLAARARKQEFEAKQAELDYLAALGRIVSVDELSRVAARRYALVRDKLLNIPDRLATIIIAERDPARAHALMTAEIKRVLNELADAAEPETAGGTAERVAA
jgi:hypothetical protein